MLFRLTENFARPGELDQACSLHFWGFPPEYPTNTFRQALKLNDLPGWNPSAPMLLADECA